MSEGREKENLLVSFSGGETSAYMAQYIWKNWRYKYNIVFVFANTGAENEETLIFVHRFSELHGFPVVWVESMPIMGQRKGTSHIVVDFKTASRNGEPFERMIQKYGIPNAAMPHCTRELKQNPISSYAKSIGWKKYYLAIGIRADEMDRMNPKMSEKRLVYPLVKLGMTKPKINFWFSQQPFRLNLKGYQGNCVTCWKKSDKKLYKIYHESHHNFSFFNKMEMSYGRYIPDTRLKLMESRGELPQSQYPIVFFRRNRSCVDIQREAIEYGDRDIEDDSQDFDSESCDVFSECGDF